MCIYFAWREYKKRDKAIEYKDEKARVAAMKNIGVIDETAEKVNQYERENRFNRDEGSDFALAILLGIVSMFMSISRILLLLSIVIGGFGVLIYFLFNKLKTNNEINKTTNYYLDYWDDVRSPLAIGYFLEGKILQQHLVGNLLKYVEKGLIKCEPILKDDQIISYKFSKISSEIYNQDVYQNLVNKKKNDKIDPKDIEILKRYNVSIAEIYCINRIIFNDQNEVNIKNIKEFYDNQNTDGNEVIELRAKITFLKKILDNELYMYGLYNSKMKKTKIGMVKQNEWLAFKDKLQNDTFLKEKKLESIKVWGENIALGVALGVCKVSLDEVKMLFENN